MRSINNAKNFLRYRLPKLLKYHLIPSSLIGISSRLTPKFWQDGISQIKHELKDQITGASDTEAAINAVKTLWKFDSVESVEEWACTSDAVIGGRSESSISFSNAGHLKFSGSLSQYVPKDGVTMKLGYSSFYSKVFKASFDRQAVLDLSGWNTFEIRLRGDGRVYTLRVVPDRTFQEHEDDQHNYHIYTKGGPYWEVIRIPFSRLFMTWRGSFASTQSPLYPNIVKQIGFTIADRVEGPFALEVDSIKVRKDFSHTETFAYESPGKEFF